MAEKRSTIRYELDAGEGSYGPFETAHSDQRTPPAASELDTNTYVFEMADTPPSYMQSTDESDSQGAKVQVRGEWGFKCTFGTMLLMNVGER